MNIKPFKFKLICCLTTSIFLLNTVTAYSAPQQQNKELDQRGFPKAQAPSGGQFKMNKPNVQRNHNQGNMNQFNMNQNKNQLRNNQNKNHNQNQGKTNQNQWNNNNWNNNQWNRHGHRQNGLFYYYNNAIYPYPSYYDYGDSYDDSYSTMPSDYTSPDTYTDQGDDQSYDQGYNQGDNQSYNQGQDYSYDSSSLPKGVWSQGSGGSVPDKAFVYELNNGAPIYYCRAAYKNTVYYGVLTPNVGCYINDESSIIHFDTYEVLTGY